MTVIATRAIIGALTIGEDTDYPFSEYPSGLGFSDVRRSRIPLIRGGSIASGPDTLGSREVVFVCRIRSNSADEHIAAEKLLLGAWAPVAADVELTLTLDGDIRILIGRPVECSITSDRARSGNYLSWARLVFEALDPLWYAAGLHHAFVVFVPPSGGFGEPFGEPFGEGAVGGSDTNVTNIGTAPAPWQLTINVLTDATDPVITVNGNQIQLVANLTAGDFVTVDSKTRRVTLNDSPRTWATFDSVWSDLPPGNSTVSLRASSGSMNGTIAWRDASF
jgi:Siphovirus-type tail component, C-terminal domain